MQDFFSKAFENMNAAERESFYKTVFLQDDSEYAAKLRDKILYMKRADAKLPDGQYFIQELIGCSVYDADDEGLCYGVLSDVSQTGANDVWHIEKDGKEYLIPAIPPVVISTDVAEGIIKIRPLRGIFDDEN